MEEITSSCVVLVLCGVFRECAYMVKSITITITRWSWTKNNQLEWSQKEKEMSWFWWVSALWGVVYDKECIHDKFVGENNSDS